MPQEEHNKTPESRADTGGNGDAPTVQTSPVYSEDLRAAQEIENLRLTARKIELEAQKTELEIRQLKRPYFMNNPQLVTAIVTTAGAVVGAYLLISQSVIQTVRTQAEEDRRAAATAKVAADEARRLESEAKQKATAQESELSLTQTRLTTAASELAKSERLLTGTRERLSDLTADLTRTTSELGGTRKVLTQVEKEVLLAKDREAAATSAAQRAERAAEDAELKPFRDLLARFAPQRLDLDETQGTTEAANDVLAHLQIKDKYGITRLSEVVASATDPAGREDRRAVLYSVVLRHTRDSRWATETLVLAEKLTGTPEGVEPRETRYGAVPRLLLLLRGISATLWTEDVEREFTLGLERLAARHQSNAGMQAALLGAACAVTAQRVRSNDLREEVVLKWGGMDKFLEVLKRVRDNFLSRPHSYPGTDDDTACLQDLFGPATVWVGTIFARQNDAAAVRTDTSALQLFLETLYPVGLRPIVSADPARWRAWLSANRKYVELWSEENLETLRRSPELLNDAVAGRSWPMPGVPALSSP